MAYAIMLDFVYQESFVAIRKSRGARRMSSSREEKLKTSISMMLSETC